MVEWNTTQNEENFRGMVVMPQISITQLKDHLRCPQLSYNIHVLGRGPAGKPVPLELGSLFHEAMEARLKGHQVSGFPFGICPSWPDVGDATRAAWAKHKLWFPINGFSTDTGWEIVYTEKMLQQHLWSGAELVGRLDAIVRWNGKYWSLQWKTFEGDLLALQERVRLSFHEVAYQWLAEQNGFKPWGGTILGACEKLPGYRMLEGPDSKKRKVEVTDEDRKNALTIHYLARDPERQAKMWWHAERQIEQLRDGLTHQPIRNFDQCFGPHGRGRCPFFGVCHEQEDLNGSQFVQLAPRYGRSGQGDGEALDQVPQEAGQEAQARTAQHG